VANRTELETLYFPASNPVTQPTTFEFTNDLVEASSRRSLGVSVLLSTGHPPDSSIFFMGIVDHVFRVSLGAVHGPDIVSGNLYTNTAYVDAPLSLIQVHKASPPHIILVECRPQDGTLRLWVDNVLYGVGSTVGRAPLPGIAWVDEEGSMANLPVKFYENQYVSLGTNRIPPGLPGTTPQFGLNVGVGMPAFRI
jgi:hypothetical protein